MPALSSRVLVRASLLSLALCALGGADASDAASASEPSSPGWFRRAFSSTAGKDAASCPLVPTASPFDLEAYVESHPWYVQEQQPNGYQPASSLFCVRAAYAWENAAKTRVAVLNTANEGGVDGPRANAGDARLRAVVPDADDPSKLAVGPRFAPSALYGPYWIVAVKPSPPRGEDDPGSPRGYDWAVVSAGQPTVPGKEKNTCRTRLRGVNGSGLWILTRDPTPSREVVEEARAAARNLRIDLSEMRAVTHEGCEYPEV